MSTVVIDLDEDDLKQFEEKGYIDICPGVHVYDNLQHILIRKSGREKESEHVC